MAEAERYDLVVIGAGPGRLRGRHPGRPARHARGLRGPRGARSAAPACASAASRPRPCSTPASSSGRRAPVWRCTASRWVRSSLDLPAMMRAEGPGGAGAHRRGRRPLQEEPASRDVNGTARIAAPDRVAIDGPGCGHRARPRASSSPRARSPATLARLRARRDRGSSVLRGGPVLRRGARTPPGDRRRGDRTRAGLGLGAPGLRGPGRRDRRSHRARAWTTS